MKLKKYKRIAKWALVALLVIGILVFLRFYSFEITSKSSRNSEVKESGEVLKTSERDGVFIFINCCGHPCGQKAKTVEPQPKPQPKPQAQPKAQPQPKPQPQPDPVITTIKPVLETKNALSVTTNSAQLSANVQNKGEPTAFWFEWGEGTSLDRKTNEFSESGSIVKSISGLKPATKYSFRVAARNKFGTFYGETRTLVTDIIVEPEKEKAPATSYELSQILRTDNASRIEESYAYLNGMVDPKDKRLDYWFEWGPTRSLKNTTNESLVTSSQSVSARITGLSAETVYYFRLAGRERGGDYYYGEIRSFVTDASYQPSPQPDPVVTTVEPVLETKNVISVTASSAQLAANVQNNGESTDVWFEWGEGTSLDRKTNEFSESGSIVKSISGLKPATKYSFRVAARNKFGTFYGETRSLVTDF